MSELEPRPSRKQTASLPTRPPYTVKAAWPTVGSTNERVTMQRAAEDLKRFLTMGSGCAEAQLIRSRIELKRMS